MSAIKRRTAAERSKKKTAMCSLRVEPHLKEAIQVIAKQRALSLSCLIEQVLRDYLESHKSNLPYEPIHQNRRRYPRKEVLIPARWRLQKGKETVEHDVLIKNISAGGAYTEYLNGKIYRLFEKDQVPSLELTVRLPGLDKPVVMECESVRFHLTRDCLGVGLRYTERIDESSVAAINEFLA